MQQVPMITTIARVHHSFWTSSTCLWKKGRIFSVNTDGSGFATLDTFYGSFSANAGSVIGHQRFTTGFSPAAIGFTYRDTYAVNANGTYDDSVTSTRYIVGPSGAVRVGFGCLVACGVVQRGGAAIVVRNPKRIAGDKRNSPRVRKLSVGVIRDAGLIRHQIGLRVGRLLGEGRHAEGQHSQK